MQARHFVGGQFVSAVGLERIQLLARALLQDDQRSDAAGLVARALSDYDRFRDRRMAQQYRLDFFGLDRQALDLDQCLAAADECR